MSKNQSGNNINNESSKEGYPIQFILLIIVIALGVLGIALKAFNLL
ncbi:MAG: hypothetical protein KGZ58_00730 [Ignavibacteriales bacterium]|nr:hypothetical protein [Ignavibacteriales bacterium]